jgi:hypothetical protein
VSASGWISDNQLDQLGKLEVWMARIAVVPREGCDLLKPDKGAYVNVLTLAASRAECHLKVSTAMNDYLLEVLEVEDVSLFSDSSGASEELAAIAQELEKSGNPKHVRFETLHTFPRIM